MLLTAVKHTERNLKNRIFFDSWKELDNKYNYYLETILKTLGPKGVVWSCIL